MDNNELGGGTPAHDQAHYGAEIEDGPALGPFIRAIGECDELAALIKARLDDHLGVSPDRVTWGDVADAERLRQHLRDAALAAGSCEEPLR